MSWLIAYDISDDRSRDKVARRLLEYGMRLQWSVFECLADERELADLLARLMEHLDPGTDLLHAFPVCAQCRRHRHVLGMPDPGVVDRYYIV